MKSELDIFAVQQLLARGIYSYRKISRLTGVAKAIVSDIARGTYAHLVETVRCRTCGSKITQTPCHACYVQREKARGRIPPLRSAA